MTYRAGDEVFHLAEGDFIWLPADAPPRLPRHRATGRCGSSASPTRGTSSGSTTRWACPAAERRLPGADGRPMAEEIPRWNAVGPRYGLEVVGPPLPEDA